MSGCSHSERRESFNQSIRSSDRPSDRSVTARPAGPVLARHIGYTPALDWIASEFCHHSFQTNPTDHTMPARPPAPNWMKFTLQCKHKSNPSHRAALISVSFIAFTSLRCKTTHTRLKARCVCLRPRPSFHWYLLSLSTNGWPG